MRDARHTHVPAVRMDERTRCQMKDKRHSCPHAGVRDRERDPEERPEPRGRKTTGVKWVKERGIQRTSC